MMRNEDRAPRIRTNEVEREATTVQEMKSQTREASNHQILFPMAVGALFLAVLVAGALLG